MAMFLIESQMFSVNKIAILASYSELHNYFNHVM